MHVRVLARAAHATGPRTPLAVTDPHASSHKETPTIRYSINCPLSLPKKLAVTTFDAKPRGNYPVSFWSPEGSTCVKVKMLTCCFRCFVANLVTASADVVNDAALPWNTTARRPFDLILRRDAGRSF